MACEATLSLIDDGSEPRAELPADLELAERPSGIWARVRHQGRARRANDRIALAQGVRRDLRAMARPRNGEAHPAWERAKALLRWRRGDRAQAGPCFPWEGKVSMDVNIPRPGSVQMIQARAT